MQSAPFYEDVSHAPTGGKVFWRHSSDGVRLRLGAWLAASGAPVQGTILLFPGRTEYLEKYGGTAGDLAQRGYATIAVDWRGQGLSDRPLKDRAVGDVTRFRDYQEDVTVLMDAARDLGLPKPYFLLSHSMGGCIALRALFEGLPVNAAVFSAPMWGLQLAPHVRFFARAIAAAATLVGLGRLYAPGTGPVTYVASAPFDDNVLTTDRDRYEMMQRQVAKHPDLALGGPSLRWVHEALRETRALRALPSPAMPCLTFLGTRERVIDSKAVIDRMHHWPNGRLDAIPGAEHEVLMEKPKTRDHVYGLMTTLFKANPERPA